MNHLARVGVAVLALSLPLSGCEKVRSWFGDNSALSCNSEDSKKLLRELLQQQLEEQGMSQMRNLLQQGATDLSPSGLSNAISQLQIDIGDVRTSRNDPQSNKKLCVAQLTLALGPNRLNDANQSRQRMQAMSVADAAALNSLKLQGDTLRHELEYAIQPTDDGKKLYAEVSNTGLLTQFVSEVLIDALRWPALSSGSLPPPPVAYPVPAPDAIAAASAAAAAAAAESLPEDSGTPVAVPEPRRVDTAQAQLDRANQQLNASWQATSREVRSQLLEDQRAWLKKRELECRLDSAAAHVSQQAEAQLACQAEATRQRIPVLRRRISQLEAQQAAEATSDDAVATASATEAPDRVERPRLSPSEAADAAAAIAARQRAEQEATEKAARAAQQQMQRNLHDLQQQLER